MNQPSSKPPAVQGVSETILPKMKLGDGSITPKIALTRARTEKFSLDNLAAAFQNCELQQVIEYLHGYDQDEIEKQINGELVLGEFPVLFFAIASNRADAVTLLLQYFKYGEGSNVCSRKSGIPALAFTILQGGTAIVNTLEVFKTLLAHGADPACIPNYMWIDVLKHPSEQLPKSTGLLPKTAWCNYGYRRLLAPHMTISHRYYLWKASLQQHSTQHEQQTIKIYNMLNLMQVPYHIVGQAASTKLLTESMFSSIVHKEEKPLVMMFAGPSGHGKTELAEQLGKLLNIESTVIDCTQMDHTQDLLGPSLGYRGYDKGSQLNNFLSLWSGKRSLVFLDEVEKMGEEARSSLLRLTGSGTYYDRRDNHEVDTKQTIFVMATNCGTSTIKRWYTEHLRHKTDAEIAGAKIDPLCMALRKEFEGYFDAPLVGRCRLIVPFLPFSPMEQAVVAHSFIMKVFTRLRKPISLEKKDLIGHIYLDLHKDEEIALEIAQSSYSPDTGARAIEGGVFSRIQCKVDTVWKSHDTDIDEVVNKGPLRRYLVHNMPAVDGQKDIQVFEKGVTKVQQ